MGLHDRQWYHDSHKERFGSRGPERHRRTAPTTHLPDLPLWWLWVAIALILGLGVGYAAGVVHQGTCIQATDIHPQSLLRWES